jgi:PAS domain S-box-containing protein
MATENATKPGRPPAAEKNQLESRLANCKRLLDASTTGLISLDKSGLIESVNAAGVKMLDAERSFLQKKPISLFIAPRDQSVFFINRSRIVSGELKAPFEIQLKKQSGAVWSARISARPVETPGQRLPGMILAVEDISRYRQALEALQFKEDTTNLLFSILEDLSTWSTADIDEIIIYSLEKVGIAAGVDRVYVCLFHHRRTRLSITHEWIGEDVQSPAAKLQGAALQSFTSLINQVKKRSPVAVADIAKLPQGGHFQADFHAPGVKSLLYAPLFFGRYLLGIIGCDAVRQPVPWPRETLRLVKCVGGAIVQALLRRQAEDAPAKIREAVFNFLPIESLPEADDSFEYQGPIEVIENEPEAVGEKKADWRIEAGEPDDPALLGTALLKDGKTANIACKDCNHQKVIDISQIRPLGSRLKVTCVCGHEMFYKVELRREHRKTVKLEGVFIKGPGDRIALKSDDWGRIQVNNLSRHGVGFKIFDAHDIRVNDRFRVKFTLDNTASSVIQKEVAVRSVTGKIIGCEFTGKDPVDVTLGFYMMN